MQRPWAVDHVVLIPHHLGARAVGDVGRAAAGALIPPLDGCGRSNEPSSKRQGRSAGATYWLTPIPPAARQLSTLGMEKVTLDGLPQVRCKCLGGCLEIG